MHIDTTDKDRYLVAWYDEQPILTNVLKALARYKLEIRGWPRSVEVRVGSRLPFGFGDDTIVKEKSGRVLDALYMSMYRPLPDDPKGKLTPTIFTGKRIPAKVPKGYTSPFRSRRNA